MNKEKEELIKKLKFLLNIAEEVDDEDYFSLLNEELEILMLDNTDYYDDEDDDYDDDED